MYSWIRTLIFCCLALSLDSSVHAQDFPSRTVRLVVGFPPGGLADILARHKGKRDWAETEVLTRDYIGEYVSMGPGQKTKTLFWADDRVFWWVQSGQMKVSIEGQEPFIASKGFLVQVPYSIPYSMETVGDEPVLRFEVRAAGEVPS